MNYKKWLRSSISLLFTLLIMSTILDVIRRPNVPEQQFSLRYNDIQQEPFFFAQLNQERPVIIYFWGTWCSICRYTSPAIQALAEEGESVISVALKSGDEEKVRSYLAENSYTFRTLNDPNGKISEQWNVSVTPTIVIFNQGKITFSTTGISSYWGLKVRLFLARFF
ncbi:MAG: protein disulfide oxidoreductase [Lonepinella koalarum]|nr:protein disulfide oxidoreductase [Lonepinella koalarum]